MKISAINSSNNTRINEVKKKSKGLSFTSGCPSSFVRDVEKLNPRGIEHKLAKIGIRSSFNRCKVVAGCVEKTVEIFKDYRLALPNKIEFVPIKENNTTLGTCTYTTGHIIINSNFSEFYDINSLNKLEESHYGFHPTKHFLATFIHEFSHNAHFHNIFKTYSLKVGSEKLLAFNSIKLSLFWEKVHANGEYAETNLNEYIAEFLTRKITTNLDDNIKFKWPPAHNIHDIFKRPNINDSKGFSFQYDSLPNDLVELMHNANNAIWKGDVNFVLKSGFGIEK